MNKQKTSIRLSEEEKTLLKKLSTHLGVSQTDVLALAIRKLAKSEQVEK